MDQAGHTRNRRDVQGLRALAVSLVIAYHAGAPFPGGFTGVDVFFVISGFVITGTLSRELVATGRIRFGHFYARRVKRLLPALAVVILFVAIAGTMASSALAQRTTALTGVAASFFAANAYLFDQLTGGYFATDTALNALLHTWTLAVEEQFYLLFPLVLAWSWAAMRRPVGDTGEDRPSIPLGAIAAIAVASFALSVLLSYRHGLGPLGARTHDFAFYSSPTRAWEFAAGAMIALGLPTSRALPRWLLESCALAGLAAVLVGARVIHGTHNFPGVEALIPVLGAAAIIAAGSHARTTTTKALGAAPLVWVGDRSYSLYLWHWPLIVFAAALLPGDRGVRAAAGVLSVFPAAASYRWLENPVRRSPRIRGARVALLAAICIAVPTIASAALLIAQEKLDQLSSVRTYLSSQDPHADATHGCDSTTPLDRRSVSACRWRAHPSKGVVVLVGDSNAGHFTEPAITASARNHFDALIVTNHACPFVALRVNVPGYSATACEHFYTHTISELVSRRPNLVIVSNGSSFYVNPANVSVATVGEDGETHVARQKAELWKAGIARTVRTLGRAGIPTVVIHQVPLIPQHGCAVFLIVTSRCNETLARSTVTRRLDASYAAENRAVASASNADAVSLFDDLCSDKNCQSRRDGYFLYRDCCHLTVKAAEQLTRRFSSVIAANARR